MHLIGDGIAVNHCPLSIIQWRFVAHIIVCLSVQRKIHAFALFLPKAGIGDIAEHFGFVRFQENFTCRFCPRNKKDFSAISVGHKIQKLRRINLQVEKFLIFLNICPVKVIQLVTDHAAGDQYIPPIRCCYLLRVYSVMNSSG